MSIDLQRYRALLQAHVGHEASLTLHPDGPRAPTSACGLLLERDLTDGSGTTRARCRITLPRRSCPAAAEFAGTLLDCIDQEFRLVSELDKMALELGQRYDELNLLFHSADESTESDDSQTALAALAEACADHVGVLGAVILFPEQHVMAVECPQGHASRRAELIQVATVFWTRLTAHRQSMVVNTPVERAAVLPSLEVKVAAAPVIVDGRARGIVCLQRDLDEEDFAASDRNLLEVIARRASTIFLLSYDMLTGLRNRRSFEASLTAAMQRAPDVTHHVLDVDVDQLRMLNDTHGPETGDEVLKFVGTCLKRNVPDDVLLGRIGSDAFAIHLPDGNLEQAVAVAESLRAAISASRPVVRGTALEVTASIGVAAFSHPAPASRGITAAENAMREAKDAGRNRVRAYDEQHEAMRRRQDDIHWVTMIRQALVEDRFVLFAQAIAPSATPQQPAHYEVLLRLEDADGRMVAPFFFMPVAERYMLMPDIDRWVVTRTLALLREYAADSTGWTINLSGQSLRDDEFQRFLLDKLREPDVPCSRLGFEITETTALGDLQSAGEFVQALRNLDCRVLLDDFGTGVATFDYLKTLPIDVLKIDGVFVKDLLDNPVSDSMVRAINQVAHVMGIETVAEFVETPAIIERLREIGIDYLQGYGVGKPAPLTELLEVADE